MPTRSRRFDRRRRPDRSDDQRPDLSRRRKLYVYVKGEHLAARPAIKEFIAAYAKAMGKGGRSRSAGWCRSAAADAAAAAAQAAALEPLDPAGLK